MPDWPKRTGASPAYEHLAQKIAKRPGVNHGNPWKPYYSKGQVTRHFMNDVMRNKRTGM